MASTRRKGEIKKRPRLRTDQDDKKGGGWLKTDMCGRPHLEKIIIQTCVFYVSLEGYIGGQQQDTGAHIAKERCLITPLRQKPIPCAYCRTIVRTSLKTLLQDSNQSKTDPFAYFRTMVCTPLKKHCLRIRLDS